MLLEKLIGYFQQIIGSPLTDFKQTDQKQINASSA